MAIASNPLLDSYQCRYLPLTLYRVDYPGAQTSYNECGGFNAASDLEPQDTSTLRKAVANHLRWRCKIPSPFISAFDDQKQAESWAQRWSKNHGEDCDIVKIRVEEEDEVVVFRVRDLVRYLDMYLPSIDPSWYHSEYLFLHRIPAELFVPYNDVHLSMRA